jgi:outer membrane immunogenic protein
MNKSLLAVAAFVALTATPVFAADMPVKAPVKMAAFDWSGFYIGANIGGSFGQTSTDWNFAGTSLGSTSGKLDGPLGGFQGGYNWQVGKYVFSMEADFTGTGQKGGSTLTFSPTGGGTFANVNDVKLPWFGTIRGRIGATPAEGWLVYFTGGAAYGDIRSDVTSSNAPAGAPVTMVTANANTVHTGWTIGGGVEAATMGNWTARLEYLYVDLGVTGGFCATASPGASSPACFLASDGSNRPFSSRLSLTDSVVRFGINYRFGATPVVAKY